MTALTWPQYPHDGLGGPQHYPVMVPSLVFTSCRMEECRCDEGECPTEEVPACARCCDGEPLIGDVTACAAWPCAASLAEDGAP